MARTRRRESTWLERLRYKYELIRRDPQAQALLKLFELDPAATQPRGSAWEQAEALGRALALKHGVPITFAGLRSRGTTGVLNPEFPIAFTVNGGHVAPALTGALRPPGDRGPHYGPWVLTHDPHEPWEHAPVVSELAFQIDVTKVTLWDKEGLASEFRTLLLRCLPFALKASGKRRGRAELAVEHTARFGPYRPQPPPGTAYEARRSQEDPTRWEYHMKLPPGAPTTPEWVTPEDWRVLTVLVNVPLVTKHDLTRLIHDFKGVLDRDLPQAPNAPRLGTVSRQDYVDGLGRQNPTELDFLHNVSPEKFYRDLRRYDLHMKHGLSFRLIAALERREQTGHPIPDAPRPRPVGQAVRGENSVEASVQRIYLAIHRTPYRTRRRRLDAPAEGQEEYRCAEHGGDCPETCPRLQRWKDQVYPTLPSDRTGMLHTVPLDAFLSWEDDEVRRPSAGWVRQPRRQD